MAKKISTALPSHSEISEAAYHRYLKRGGSHGGDFEDWVEAERELNELSASSAAAPKAPSARPRAESPKSRAAAKTPTARASNSKAKA